MFFVYLDLLGSFLTGWGADDNQYTTATSLAGPWSSWSYFAPTGTHTYNSQTTYVLPVTGTQGTTFLYMEDRWTTGNLGTSPYIWLPLNVNGTSVSMSWYNNWWIDTATGLWGTGSTPTPTPIPTATAASTPITGAACSVYYAITNQWQGGFGANVTINNTGNTAINGWTLTWSFANGQTITQLFSHERLACEPI